MVVVVVGGGGGEYPFEITQRCIKNWESPLTSY